MQFGILYSYWSREWACDLEGYAKIIKKVSDLGFDILEISAHHVYEMSQDELRKLNALAQERGSLSPPTAVPPSSMIWPRLIRQCVSRASSISTPS